MSLIPSTFPFHELSARIESPCGIAIETSDFDGRACQGPMSKSENGAPVFVS